MILTKDNFLHIYEQNKKKKHPNAENLCDVDYSNPLLSVNLNNLKAIDDNPKNEKENKIELVQGKPTQASLTKKDTLVKHIDLLKKAEGNSISVNLQKLQELSQAPKFSERIILKAKKSEDYFEWMEMIRLAAGGNQTQ